VSAFYNENDPKAAAWLRELIRRDLIAPGIVDERSIEDIAPNELAGYTQCHFFAGIGGWSYALRLAGWPDDRPVEYRQQGESVMERFINVYPPELTEMGQEEFVHLTAEDAAKNLNAGGTTIRFIAAPPIPAVPGGLSDGELSALAKVELLADEDSPARTICAALRRLASQPVAAGVGEDTEYEIWQDSSPVAGASGQRRAAILEVLHYANQYEQDGPIEIFEVKRTEVTLEQLQSVLGIAAKGEGN
jgi:hypothetical protein